MFSVFRKIVSLPTKNLTSFSTVSSELLATKDWLSSYPGGNVQLDTTNPDIYVVKWEHFQRKNSFTGSMLAKLDDIITDLEYNCPKGVIFCGANENFCSGADLKFIEKIANHDDGSKITKFMHNVTNRITCLPAVSVALVEGSAHGAGVELAMCADFRVGTPNSSIRFTQTQMGVTPGWGGGSRLVSIVGRQMALRLLLTGDCLASQEALRIQLYDHILPGKPVDFSGGRLQVNHPLNETICWLSKLFSKESKSSVHTTKNMIRQISFPMIKGSLEDEKKIFENVWGGKDHLKALHLSPEKLNDTD